MSTGQLGMAYMHVTGSTQGEFGGDGTKAAGDKRTLCHAVRLRGDVPHDVRGGTHAVTRHEPISVIHEWSPATVQFLSALWSNEVLSEIRFDFVRQDSGGKEEVYATLTLTKATVAYAELRTGRSERLIDGEHRGLGDIGLHAEKMEFKLKSGSGQVTATYDRTKS